MILPFLSALFIFGHSPTTHALGSIPSPTDVAIPSNASKVFKVHNWNTLNVDKYNNGGKYNVRTDFDLSIPNDAWSNEGIAIMGFEEICKTSVQQFAATNSIPTANYRFTNYKGSSYAGSNPAAYDIDNNACREQSGDITDEFGFAIIARGTAINSQTYRNTLPARTGYGERGITCVKTNYLDRIIASCATHPQFNSSDPVPSAITQTQLIENEANARDYAYNNAPVADHLFMPGDYNLSPTFSVAKPGPIMDQQWQGHNTDLTYPSLNPNRRIDHIYFSKSLQYLTTDTTLCSGVGIVNGTSSPTYPDGDHCYIGAIAYEVNPTAADVKQDPITATSQRIPGAPKAGDIVNNSVTPLISAAVLVSAGVSYLLYRRRQS